jgi:hypothetical protein
MGVAVVVFVVVSVAVVDDVDVTYSNSDLSLICGGGGDGIRRLSIQGMAWFASTI